MYTKKYGVVVILAFVAFFNGNCMEQPEMFGGGPSSPRISALRRKSAPSTLHHGVVLNMQRSQCRHACSAPTLPELRKQEPKNIHVVTLFCDLRGFTSMCDRYGDSPERALMELNPYHEEFARIITLYDGHVINTYGDALYAVFSVDGIDEDGGSGDEEEVDDAPLCLQAVISAHAMLNEIQTINRLRVDRGCPPLVFGIGVALGVICASKLRGVTVNIGTPANVAQRLEDLNKDPVIRLRLGGDATAPFSSMVISDAVYDKLPAFLRYTYNTQHVEFEKRLFIDLGLIPLRGIQHPVHAYGIGH